MLISEQHLTEFAEPVIRYANIQHGYGKKHFVRILITKSVWDLYYNSVTISQMLITTDNNFNLPCLCFKLFAKSAPPIWWEPGVLCTQTLMGMYTHTPHHNKAQDKFLSLLAMFLYRHVNTDWTCFCKKFYLNNYLVMWSEFYIQQK